MSKINILVTGANGQLGSEIRVLSEKFNTANFVFTDRLNLDITKKESIEEAVQKNAIDYIINCAAYTAVDNAEDDIEACYSINRDAVANIAKVASSHNAKVIHISTDYVFDGMATTPYKTTDAVAPNSVYGKSKLEGEQLLMKYCPDSVIIRTSWLYSSFGNNFVKTMIRLGQERDTLSVVSDQKGSPTYAADLAKAILDIINYSEAKEFKAGIYHYSNQGVTNWFEFCSEIHKLANVDCTIKPINTSDYPTKAKRPAYSVMSTEKIRESFEIDIPKWKTSLKECITLLQK